jgi:hypothetical protein
MPRPLDPSRIDTETSYLAALDELEALLAEDPDSPAGHRVDELVALIEDYEARFGPPPLPEKWSPRVH